jgi:hypothetical protein
VEDCDVQGARVEHLVHQRWPCRAVKDQGHCKVARQRPDLRRCDGGAVLQGRRWPPPRAGWGHPLCSRKGCDSRAVVAGPSPLASRYLVTCVDRTLQWPWVKDIHRSRCGYDVKHTPANCGGISTANTKRSRSGVLSWASPSGCGGEGAPTRGDC